jgi:hypothetical protein
MKGRPRMAGDSATLERLDQLIAKIRTYPDPRRASEEWKQVFKLLGATDTPPGRITGIVGMRDVARLSELVEQLRSPAGAPAEQNFDPEVLRKAIRAFRKRQALTQLDDESKLGHSPLSKGADPRLAPITPPTEWPEPVWQELVRQGRLRYIGQGFYELPKGSKDYD